MVYYGAVGHLPDFDPVLWKWRTNQPLMMYSAKAGKEVLNERTQLKTPIAEKWREEYTLNFQLDWKKLWKSRSQKEAAFLWSLWHQAIATNSWPSKYNPRANSCCPLCLTPCQENYFYKFYHCPQAKRVWAVAFLVVHWLCRGTRNLGPPKTFPLDQCLYGRRTRIRMKGVA